MAETSTYKSGHTGQQIDTAVNKVSDSSLNSSKEGHLITLDSSGNLKASDKTISNIETLESEVSRIDTAQTNIGNTVESLEDDLEDISGRVATINTHVNNLEDFKDEQLLENQSILDSIDDINASIRGIYDDIDSLERRDEEISGRVNLLNSRVNTLEGRVADQEENLRIFGIGLASASRNITDLQNRVSHLEGQTLPSDVRVIYENDELNEGE